MLGTCHRVRRARCRLRARRTCCSYPLARPCAVVWCCVLAGPRLSARAMLPSACLAHGGETEVETARARLSGVVPRTVSTLVSIHRHHSKRRQPKGHDLGLSRLASSARRALELKARVASEPPAPASRHGSFRDRLYLGSNTTHLPKRCLETRAEQNMHVDDGAGTRLARGLSRAA